MSSFRRLITVKRVSSGSYVDGYYVEGQEEIFEIQASVQPTTTTIAGDLLQNEQQGRRVASSYILYTSVPLRTAHNSNADRVVINGLEHEVVQVEAWQSGVISHYKCLCRAKHE